MKHPNTLPDSRDGRVGYGVVRACRLASLALVWGPGNVHSMLIVLLMSKLAAKYIAIVRIERRFDPFRIWRNPEQSLVSDRPIALRSSTSLMKGRRLLFR